MRYSSLIFTSDGASSCELFCGKTLILNSVGRNNPLCAFRYADRALTGTGAWAVHGCCLITEQQTVKGDNQSGKGRTLPLSMPCSRAVSWRSHCNLGVSALMCVVIRIAN